MSTVIKKLHFSKRLFDNEKSLVSLSFSVFLLLSKVIIRKLRSNGNFTYYNLPIMTPFLFNNASLSFFLKKIFLFIVFVNLWERQDGLAEIGSPLDLLAFIKHDMPC